MAKTSVLTTAWRNLIRRKNYSFINIAGLSLALAACLVIFTIEYREFSYDRYHAHAAQIYQLVKTERTQNEVAYEVSIPFEATRALRHDYPQITFGECYVNGETQVTVGSTGQKYIENNNVWYADREIFGLFDVKWLDGDASVLAGENMVVLTETVAEKYFGRWSEAMGKDLRLGATTTVRVGGVIADPPGNTDFPFRLIVSYPTFVANHAAFGYDDLAGWSWGVSNHQVYALVPSNADVAAINKSLPSFLRKYYVPDSAMSVDTYYLRSLSDVHFDTRFENNGDHASSRASLYTLGLVGLLILCMACINFINLTTAQAIRRSKEIGVRKIMGSGRGRLVWQMLADTAMLVFVSMLAAVLLAQVCLPFIKYIYPIVSPLELLTLETLPYMVGIWLLVTLLSGIYPALRLSRFNPIEAVRYTAGAVRSDGISLRRVLVVVQFAFSQLLIIATLVVVAQMSYIRHADMGVTRETVVLLKGRSDSTYYSRQRVFAQEVKGLAEVESVSLGFDAPPSGTSWGNDFSFDHRAKPEPFNARLKFGDANYARTFGLQMAAGSWYAENDTTGKAVINETMVRRLGLGSAQAAVGKTIRVGEGAWREIAGVVRDFKNASLKEEVPANIIFNSKRFHQMTAVRLKTRNPGRSLAEIETVWNRYFPEYAMNSSFMDEDIARFYEQERRLTVAFNAFMVIAIWISLLGLYGLVSFMAVQRTKEVGIRKVLGASVGNIVYLFSREFTVLVVVAFLVAGPIAWYVMNGWLQNFAFRVHIGSGIFVGAFVLSLALAWLTVGYKSVRAALANPTKSLRSE